MLFEKNPELKLLECNTCYGSGFVGFKTCGECKGMSMGMLKNEDFIYFGEPLTRYQISVKKARRSLNKVRILTGLVFGLGFWSLFAWFLYKNTWFDYIFTYQFWFEDVVIIKSLFWLGLIFIFYLFYRLVVLNKPSKEITKKNDNKNLQENNELILPSGWNEIVKKRGKNKLDIAKTFTDPAIKVLEDAYILADKYNTPELNSIHIFYSLLSDVTIANLFIRLGVSTKVLQAKLAKQFKTKQAETIPLISKETKNIIFNAYELAYEFKDSHVRVTEILLATVRQSENLQEMLYDLNIEAQKLKNVIEWVRVREKLREQYFKLRKAAALRNKHGMDRAMTAVATPFLNRFSQDLTMMAKFGHLTPCIARDKEIDEIFRIIEGGRQSVILVGEEGVGKMAIIEGVAQKMLEDEVPEMLNDKRLVQISTSSLLAGTTVSGAQERLIMIMNEVSRAGNIILFIKNIHDLIGSGDGQGESLDVSETLSEFIGPGKVFLFATTMPESYNRHVLNSQIGQALSRVEIKEMDENQTVQVLQSKIGGVEYKQQVFFSYDALESCVKLSKRFLNDQNLPESAISLMAEVGSYVRSKKGTDEFVLADDVGQVVSEKTGVQATSVTENESTKLLRLEQEMHERVIGQDQAVVLVANALRRARVDIRSRNRPIANFLFLGPTGVGKTELAKTIAVTYFGGENQMIRIDMSEYQDKNSIYRLIGQTGQQGTGILTEAVRQKPFSLILLDELEKADPNVLNLFLQVFDDGRLTDSTGRVIDFTNTIIIATSNAGTSFVQKRLNENVDLITIREELIRTELKDNYRPEFLNRFDGIVLFKPLEKGEIKQIASLMLKRVAKDLENRGVELRVETEALDSLVEVGYDPEFGARPMRRAIQEHVENKLAELILSGKLNRRDIIVLGAQLKIDIQTGVII